MKYKHGPTWSYGRHRNNPMTNKLPSFFKSGDPQGSQSGKDHLPESSSQFFLDEPPQPSAQSLQVSVSPFWR